MLCVYVKVFHGSCVVNVCTDVRYVCYALCVCYDMRICTILCYVRMRCSYIGYVVFCMLYMYVMRAFRLRYVYM